MIKCDLRAYLPSDDFTQIRPLHGPEGLEFFVHTQATLGVDLQAFSEHCLDTTKFRVYQTAKDILRTTYPTQATIQLSSSFEPATNQYKPGGTGILILGSLTSRLEPNGKGGDTLGRWTYTSFRRKHLPPVTVISVYQVCPRPTNVIGNTAYHQQQRALNKAGRSLSPRKAFMTDLTQFIADQLVDPFSTRFPHHPEFGTHITGKRRIDMVLVTPGLLPSVQAVGYAPYEHASFSDHRPVVIDFNSTILFGYGPSPIPPSSSRLVNTKDKQSVMKFITELYSELNAKHAFRLQSQLDDDTANPQMVEDLDFIIGVCEEKAEQQCKRRRPEFYTRQIVQQRFIISTLTRHRQRAEKIQRYSPTTPGKNGPYRNIRRVTRDTSIDTESVSPSSVHAPGNETKEF